jgi:hypothetical protein
MQRGGDGYGVYRHTLLLLQAALSHSVVSLLLLLLLLLQAVRKALRAAKGTDHPAAG